VRKVDLIIVGAGNRGTGYATYALAHPERARVVGVAEPRDAYRKKFVATHGIPTGNTSHHWRDLLQRPNFADAVIIATQDTDHTEPAIRFAEKGYNILLEKPMATNERDCREIVRSAIKAGIIFAVCHVLRYTNYTKKLKELVDNGIIGDVVNIQRLESVGYWHQAHSFVRGNWRKESESSPMLLAKCCHDLDWIRYVMGDRCTAVQSFGSLRHFRSDQKPEGAADRCLDCTCEPMCPYSAKKFYLGRIADGRTGWPLDILAADISEESITNALRQGPYGRCVYRCDNDVVDNQIVNLAFQNGSTASLTMTAFTEARQRQTRVFGTRGELTGDGSTILHFDFLKDTRERFETEPHQHPVLGFHGGGDYGLMRAFVDAVASNDPRHILSGPSEILESHLMVFAAETSRRENRVVNMQEFDNAL